MPYTLAILAGDRYREAFLVDGVNKALLTFGGRSCLERLIAAVEQAPSFEAMVVVGPPALDPVIDHARGSKPVKRVDQGISLMDNMRRAYDAVELDASEQLFLTTVDIPLVLPGEFERFVSLVEESPANAIVAFASGSWHTQHGGLAQHYQRSMIVARGGPYLMGNLFAGPRAVLQCGEILEPARNVRKQSKFSNVLRAFRIFVFLGPRAGPAIVVWLRSTAARWLWLRHRDYSRIPWIAPGLRQLARATTKLVRGKVEVGIVDIGAEGACFDLDDTEQYEAMQQLLKA
ncbi:MAG: nucleotidyltransferase family protein [Gemmatimonadota bacterium]|nr:MAG: nucleotidyltransferase family protein [Gemmatimonadota bacterium]